MTRLRRAPLALALAPPAACAALVARYAVDVPAWDDFERAGWLGGLVLAQWETFALVALTALAVHGLLRRSFAGRPRALWTLTFLAGVLLFSPLQWQTFLHAAALRLVLPPAVLCLALLVLRPGRGRLRSIGPGLGIGLGAVAFAAWCLAGAAAPRADESALRFLGAFLGSPLARTTVLEPAGVAPWAAGLLVVAFAFGGARTLGARRRGDEAAFARALPWLLLGGYALGTAAVLACSGSLRAGAGDGLAPRFLVVSTWLLLADAVLLALVAGDREPRGSAAEGAFLRSATAVAAGALLGVQALQWTIGVAGMREWQSARLQARTAMFFLDRFEPVWARRISDPGSVHAQVARFVRAGGLPSASPATSAAGGPLAPFAVQEAPLAPHDAQIQHAVVSHGRLVVEGFAWLAAEGRRADGVLLTVRDEAGERRVAGLAELHGVPVMHFPEADHLFNELALPGVEDFGGFRGSVDLAGLASLASPSARESVDLELWAVDSLRLRAWPFAREVRVRATPAGPRAALVPGGTAGARPGSGTLRPHGE